MVIKRSASRVESHLGEVLAGNGAAFEICAQLASEVGCQRRRDWQMKSLRGAEIALRFDEHQSIIA